MDFNQHTRYSGGHPADTSYREDSFPRKMASPNHMSRFNIDDFMSQTTHTHPSHAPLQWDQQDIFHNVALPPHALFDVPDRGPHYPQAHGSPQSQSQSTSSGVQSPPMEPEAYFTHSSPEGYAFDNLHQTAGFGDQFMQGLVNVAPSQLEIDPCLGNDGTSSPGSVHEHHTTVSNHPSPAPSQDLMDLDPASPAPRPETRHRIRTNHRVRNKGTKRKVPTLQKPTHDRAFKCVFYFGGCPSTFASKNEWKRHVLSQHVLLYYWHCTEPACVDANKETNGAIFNRKDLYTQHVRRMHVPQNFRKALKSRKSVPAWDAQLRQMQEKALRHRCQLPTYLRCPASGCSMEFHGGNAWDDRMEHVARHLEKAALGEEPEVHFGGMADPTLNEWASSPDVGIIRRAGGEDRWEFAQPLKTTSQVGGGAAKNAKEPHSDSEDGVFELE
jgi:hypothetical protein